MSFDAWMNITGTGGVVMYLFAWWWHVRGESEALRTFNRIARMCGAGLILSTLFMRWYLSESLIVFVSLCMACVFGYFVVRARSKA